MGSEVWTQIIVVGAGNAALSAAVAARERGVDVVVLEKAPRQHRGGNSALTVHMRFPYDGMEELTPLLSGTPSADLRRMADRISRYTSRRLLQRYYDRNGGQERPGTRGGLGLSGCPSLSGG